MKTFFVLSYTAPFHYPCHGVPRTLQGYADGTAHLAIQLNPNPYSFPNNQNGLVLVGYAIADEFRFPEDIGIQRIHPQQREYYHHLTYIYGRQIPTNTSNQ